MRKSYPIAVVLMILALVPAWVGFAAFIEARGFEARAVEATGTITRYQGYPGLKGRITGRSFVPMVLFELEEGVWAEVAANLASKNDAAKIGSEVPVLYDPAGADHVRFAGFYSLYGAAAYFAVPAVLLFLFGFYLLPMGARAPRDSRGRMTGRPPHSAQREA